MKIYIKLSFKPLHKLFNKLFHMYLYLNRNKPLMITSTIDGITYQLNLHEQIDSALFFLGSFDQHTNNAIKRLCKKGMTALDIGANVGAYTFILAKLVGKYGKIIAFEPMSNAFSKLKRNMALNNFQNITLEKLALTNESKKEYAMFRTSWLVRGGSRIDSQKNEEIYFITLDDYLKKKGIKKVDFIKIDVDGYEFKVVQGAINTLKKNKPILILELGIYTLEKNGDKIEDFILFLLNLGYRFYSQFNFKEFPSVNAMINSIPEHSTIDVIASVINLI